MSYSQEYLRENRKGALRTVAIETLIREVD